jgi:8-oxo-dGTP diphosphatase
MDHDEPITVTAAILMHEGRVLITRRPPDGRHPGSWEFPGGKVEPQETPEQCLARELAEELAITVEVGELLARTRYSYPDLAIDLLAFDCSMTAGTPTCLGCDALEWVGPAGLSDYDLLPPDRLLAHEIFGDDA